MSKLATGPLSLLRSDSSLTHEGSVSPLVQFIYLWDYRQGAPQLIQSLIDASPIEAEVGLHLSYKTEQDGGCPGDR